ncbi:hypothetical protein DDE01_01610 [Desulfovibrio desulfuricans]|nr:hypothetical protein DDE01_01610 [Desulfovibrio desulfuricans]
MLHVWHVPSLDAADVRWCFAQDDRAPDMVPYTARQVFAGRLAGRLAERLAERLAGRLPSTWRAHDGHTSGNASATRNKEGAEGV